jgi:hypothetical protein
MLGPDRVAGLSLLLLAVACGPGGEPADAGRDAWQDGDRPEASDADAEPANGAEPDADADHGREAEPGPMTLVLAELAVLADRLCDLDGDGDLDNAVADLGSPMAELFAGAITTAVMGTFDSSRKIVMHAPWLEDLAGPDDPDAVMVAFSGLDDELGEDYSDDLSGNESFWLNTTGMDPCGEPLYVFEHLSIEHGLATGSAETAPLPADMVAVAARAEGTIAPFGASADLEICGILRVRELGAAQGAFVPTGDLTALEVFLAGGAVFGYPQLPGVLPDVDGDGDGLERILLDDRSRVASCIDGDGTVTAGRDCWSDAGMADGFSINMGLHAIPAVFAGRLPGWEAHFRSIGETCEDPPEHSLLDPR